MSSKYKLATIITAGGSGSRFQSKIPKQFLKFRDKEVLSLNISKWLSIKFINKVIVIIPEKNFDHNRDKLLDQFNSIKVVKGGDSRTKSIKHGLKEIDNEYFDYIFIHDGARPFFSKDLISKMVKKIGEYKAIIPVLPITDCLKICENSFVKETVNRDRYYITQTPQLFQFDLIKKVYKKFDKIYYDDSSMVEQLGESVYTIEGEWQNIKITSQTQIPLINFLMERENDTI